VAEAGPYAKSKGRARSWPKIFLNFWPTGKTSGSEAVLSWLKITTAVAEIHQL
jgi:hypothetical protein